LNKPFFSCSGEKPPRPEKTGKYRRSKSASNYASCSVPVESEVKGNPADKHQQDYREYIYKNQRKA
jgi:hypothetical protein